MTGYETIIVDTDGPVAVIRLNRPHRMNAVVERMYEELGLALGTIAGDGAIRAAIITGSVRLKDGVEKQAFCAGADLKEHASGGRSDEQKRAYILLAHETTRMLAQLRVPLIAAVNGPARGAGAEMALCCDFILMAEEATIAFPETGLGTFVGGGATYHLPRLVGLMRAKELVYTGRVLDGREAVSLGLAMACFPAADLTREAMGLARLLARKAPFSMELAKKRLDAAAMLELGAAIDLETEAILACMRTEDWHEGVRAFAEGREPVFEGR